MDRGEGREPSSLLQHSINRFIIDSHKTLEGFTGHTQNGLDGVLEKILAARLTVLAELDITAFSSPEPLTWEHRLEGEERTLRVGDKWGGLFDCAWMHFTGVVPPDAPSSSLVLLLDVNGEMCVFAKQRCPALPQASAAWVAKAIEPAWAVRVAPIRGGVVGAASGDGVAGYATAVSRRIGRSRR